MDDLAISAEELAQVTGTSNDISRSSSSASAKPGRRMDDLPGLGAMSDTGFPPPPLAEPAADPFAGAPTTQPKPDVTARPVQFAPLEPSGASASHTNLDLLLGVTLQVTVELGRTKMNIEEILNLGPGSVIELEKLAGEPVDVLVNDKMIARGEVVVLDDRFGVRITDVLPPAQRLNSLK